ncbi:MAG: NeuD/PglB/VioB family sugar acetyltransferase [Anaerolineaceae bacterium]|nr:NeuD/PglB/VioB family sugar acetyltransferase [Anaerolineaceae bacterium]
MSEKLIPIQVPLLNPNEKEALLVAMEAAEGESIQQDDLIAVVETTKSTGEVTAPAAGYLVGVRFQPGQSMVAGEVLAYIGESPDSNDPTLSPWAKDAEPTEDTSPQGLRITAPAQALAEGNGLDLADLPLGPLVTRQMVADLLAQKVAPSLPPIPEGENRLVIFGAGGHGRSLAALIQKMGGFELLGFVDDGVPAGETVLGLPVLGGRDALAKLAADGIRLAINGVGGIGNLNARLSVFDLLRQSGFQCPKVIHPTAFIEDSAILADGVQVFPLAYVGTEVTAGFGTIINTGAIVSHDCQLGRTVNLSPGATLAGGVTVGEGTLIGMRATVNLNVKIGAYALVGNGATVKADVPDRGVVPAGTIWPPHK